MVFQLQPGNMAWWDSSGLSSFATQALKSAQKSIDKVLDIEVEEGEDGVKPSKHEIRYFFVVVYCWLLFSCCASVFQA